MVIKKRQAAHDVKPTKQDEVERRKACNAEHGT